MNQHYFGKDGGFYCTALHGQRTIMVADPSWVRPTILVPDPEWTGTDPAPSIEVPDLAAVAPMLEQSNPDCSLIAEADLVEITSEQYESLQLAITQGNRVIPDSNGLPLVVSAALPVYQQWAGQITARRYDEETKGITVDGTQIDTGRDSQALITGATVSAMLDPAYVCIWKTLSGPVRLNAADLIKISTSVRTHVQACFDRESELLALLAAGQFNIEMLDEGWPQ
ncbi:MULTISPECIES: DUF4376 domain-containing protein [unclassified Pseudomonas]|uniref:DUF4376 domain-containing protein n=1 Tax=unclassified Pseudomonas TaxID=196821 RepID=UPI0011AD9B11|nr:MULTISPECIES: DUF4376 domain-containing protein [unclassified Pseudomonas]TWC21119.1 uncharacterized protein DUF4376 [Pseudomonas sp. SJZ075]TWC36599.1 uncharacterized protein DUF4376 [Pseudomonas sp. SJZ078]TWC57358.1 uncharacterized protein DUF4376 [Pseudomonas sp. SJZ124]TWC92345.1 uncharacterized protein DUF4376 [Pseudomonas sp. SJZ101]